MKIIWIFQLVFKVWKQGVDGGNFLLVWTVAEQLTWVNYNDFNMNFVEKTVNYLLMLYFFDFDNLRVIKAAPYALTWRLAA